MPPANSTWRVLPRRSRGPGRARRTGRGAAAALAATVLVAAAGCGGASSRSYSLAATQACLRKAGFPASVVTNFYLQGTGGNLRVRLTNAGPALLAPNTPTGSISPDQYVFLVFDASPAAAAAAEQKALRLAQRSLHSHGILMSNAAVEQTVGLSENVFYYSATQNITRAERATITRCLR